MESAGPSDSRYPATTKRAAGYIKDVPTDAMVVGFADKLLITVTQAGRLAQWVLSSTDRRTVIERG